MAEVLITLGIIGVVAAITLPSLIQNYKRKVLETQYKKSVSVVSQAIQKTKLDLGVDNLREHCISYDGVGYVNANECYNALYDNTFKMNKKRVFTDSGWGNGYSSQINRIKDGIKTYNGKQEITNTALAGIGHVIFYANIMPDGSFLNYWITEAYLNVGIDSNGKKAPNKLGHDIFIFSLSPNDTLYYRAAPTVATDEEIAGMDTEYRQERLGNPCNLTSNQKGNGIGCAYYALRDECPYDSKRRYFECLP